MTHSKLGPTVVLVIVALVGVGALAASAYVRRPRPTPAMRGLALAQTLGCFACHGPGGTGGVPNPGSEDVEVPAWDGGTSMMFVHNEQEIREWIFDGVPKRLAKSEPGGPPPASGETFQEAETDSPTVDMPAFRGFISDDDLENLVAYYKAVAVFDRIPEAAKTGFDVARRSGCFGCHGPGGRVGSVNPRSLKGYIPPWQGQDFAELVKNDAELREWILKGRIARFESNPVARFFTRRQVIHMPAYEDILKEGEVDELAGYIDWLQTTGD